LGYSDLLQWIVVQKRLKTTDPHISVNVYTQGWMLEF